MAYIPASKSREIAKNLKSAFPDMKFSVRNDRNSALDVSIMKGPMKFEKDYMQVNHYYPDRYGENGKTLRKIIEICNEGNYNNSDIQNDYHDVGWYFNLNVGKWDKPYVCTSE